MTQFAKLFQNGSSQAVRLPRELRFKGDKVRIHRVGKSVVLEPLRGRTVERVELNLDSDFHCISIRFQNDTDLTFVIDPALTFRADYSRWKAGNQKILKRWSPVSSWDVIHRASATLGFL